MYEVSFQLLCTKKAGTLSRLIRDIKLFGLQYQNHNIEYQDDQTLITINSSGELNCPQDRLIELMLEFSEVLEVKELTVSRDGVAVTEVKTKAASTLIPAQEPLTPFILLAAEKRLSETMGPIAALLVETAAKSCSTAGELYLKLSEELNDQAERQEFLSVIENDDPFK